MVAGGAADLRHVVEWRRVSGREDARGGELFVRIELLPAALQGTDGWEFG